MVIDTCAIRRASSFAIVSAQECNEVTMHRSKAKRSLNETIVSGCVSNRWVMCGPSLTRSHADHRIVCVGNGSGSLCQYQSLEERGHRNCVVGSDFSWTEGLFPGGERREDMAEVDDDVMISRF